MSITQAIRSLKEEMEREEDFTGKRIGDRVLSICICADAGCKCRPANHK